MRRLSALVLFASLLALPAPALAGANPGGASADPSPAALASSAAGGVSADAPAPAAPASTPGAANGPAGGAQYGVAAARRKIVRPVATLLGVRSITEGHTPRIRLRIDERGINAVTARVVVLRVPGNAPVARIVLGRVPTGRTVSVAWPRGVRLPAGQYLVRVHAKDRHNHNLARLAHASGRTTLVVSPKAAPPPPPAPTISDPQAPAPTNSSPAPGTVLPGGVFPVAGPHTYGDGFGVARSGWAHQGQDVLAAEGTQVVAPVAGTITSTNYQASAAGYYVVEQATDGRSFFFAHCQKNSFGAQAGQVVAAGAPICRVGHTGDATGPHLHFEEWLGGWRVDSRSRPVDPLPQLKAWDKG